MAFLDFLDPRRRRLAEQGLEPANLEPPMGGGVPMSDTAPVRPPSLPWTPNAVVAMNNDAFVPTRPAGLPGDPTGTPPTFPTSMPGVPERRSANLPDISQAPPAPGARPIQPMLGPSLAGTGPGPAIEPVAAPTQYERLEAERQGYMRGTPSRKKSALLGVLSGVAQGLAGGGGLGGAIGGALAGGAYGAIDPRGLRGRTFETREKPKILERLAMEDQEKARQAAAVKAALDAGMSQAQIQNIQSQIQSRQQQDVLNQQQADREANKPTIVAPGASVLRPGDKAPVFTAPARPTPEKAPTAAELSIEPESGKSAEEISNDSYIGRGGDQYVFGRLPKRTQALLNGEIADANPAELMAAQREFDNAIRKEKADILSYTKGEIRSKVLGRRKGGQSRTTSPAQRRGQPGRTVISVDEAARLLQ